MSLNAGYYTSKNNRESDELYTPYYGVYPLIKYLKTPSTIWCPFDQEWSAFVNVFQEAEHRVIRSHIEDGMDFFEYEPPAYDVIVSNPPWSLKDSILERAYELEKPFALLLPITSLQGHARYQLFKRGIQVLAFDKRITFHSALRMEAPWKVCPFASAYFCRNLLPNDLIIEELVKLDKPLKNF